MPPLAPSTANVYGPYRYATAERFGAPEVVPHLEPVEAAICPQSPSIFDAFTGPTQNITQSEDCLQLVVYAKSSPRRKRWDPTQFHPVMVFIHGGSFLTGGGVLDWYDGRRLAQKDVVVVSINYRLGALGFLATDGGDTLNGHRDILAALKWVKAHATDFGGDPDRVTLFGQSAGALAIAGMYRDPASKPYYRSAIMESGPLPMITDRTVEETQGIAANFTQLLGSDPRDASVADILAAQDKVVSTRLPFFPLVEGDVQAHGPLIAGWNKDDATGFGVALGENSTKVTEATYGPSTKAFEVELKKAGCDAATYIFTIDPGPWGSTHGAELPYILGTREAWSDAPIINETNWHEIDDQGWPMRKAWTDFAKYADLNQVKSLGVWYLDWLN